MKTTYKTILTGAQARAKQIELEAKTGLKLSVYSTGNGYNFVPYMHKDIEPKSDNISQIIPLLPTKGMDAVSFVHLSKVTGLKIQDVLEACQYLLKTRTATGVIGRGGKVIGIYSAKDSE